jgi:hypothetical protein
MNNPWKTFQKWLKASPALGSAQAFNKQSFETIACSVFELHEKNITIRALDKELNDRSSYLLHNLFVWLLHQKESRAIIEQRELLTKRSKLVNEALEIHLEILRDNGRLMQQLTNTVTAVADGRLEISQLDTKLLHRYREILIYAENTQAETARAALEMNHSINVAELTATMEQRLDFLHDWVEHMIELTEG